MVVYFRNKIEESPQFQATLDAQEANAKDATSADVTHVVIDGRPVFETRDNAFLYTFGCYACSSAPLKLLTIVQYDKAPDGAPYVNSMWEQQKEPYGGDVVADRGLAVARAGGAPGHHGRAVPRRECRWWSPGAGERRSSVLDRFGDVCASTTPETRA